jgi:hypothetical protein
LIFNVRVQGQQVLRVTKMSQGNVFESAQRRAIGKLGQFAVCALLVMLVGIAAESTAAFGQQRPGFPQAPAQPAAGVDNETPGGSSPEMEKLLRSQNAERQKSLVSDTNKLLRLTNELNAEIARTGPDALSDNQLRKLAEIEKLAHSVKEKMSTSVRGTPAFRPAPFPNQQFPNQ